jgi:hypothetical protein
MNGNDDWSMGALADQNGYGLDPPDERGLQPPEAWPQQPPTSFDPQAWPALPTRMASWPAMPSAPTDDEQQAVRDASMAAANKMRQPYLNALARDPSTNRLNDVAEGLAPTTPLDYALLASGPLGRTAKMGAIAAGAVMTPTEALAGKKDMVLRAAQRLVGYAPEEVQAFQRFGGLHDPTDFGNWMVRHGGEYPQLADIAAGSHGFSNLATSLPIDEMSYQLSRGKPLAPLQKYDIADLQKQNASLVFGVTDRTAGLPQNLVRVGETKLETPVPQEGGVNYALLHANEPVPGTPQGTVRIFANAPAASTKMIKDALEVQKEGRTPFFTPAVMAKGSGDSSPQVANTAYQVVSQSEPSKATMTEINKQVKKEIGEIKGQPAFKYPGFNSDELPDWLAQSGGNFRGAFVRGLDKGSVQERPGMPDIGEVRYANTDPRLRNTPVGASGLFVAKMAPELGAIEDSLHSNYPSSILGPASGLGSLGGSVPFHLIGPDLHRALMQSGEIKRFANAPTYYLMQGMPGGIPKVQPVTQEVVDNVSNFFRRQPIGWAAAGAVPMGGIAYKASKMGDLASQNEYSDY